MDGDRRVMYDRWRKDGAHSNEWMVVTKAFLEHAFKDATGRLVKCPCNRCENKWPQKKEEMEKHLCKSGTEGPGHRYGADGHLGIARRMVSI
jgi:hypothetical protein